MGDDTSDDGASGSLDSNSVPSGGSDNTLAPVTSAIDNPSNNLSLDDLLSAITGTSTDSGDPAAAAASSDPSSSNPLAALSSIPTTDWLIIGGGVLLLVLLMGRRK